MLMGISHGYANNLWRVQLHPNAIGFGLIALRDPSGSCRWVKYNPTLFPLGNLVCPPPGIIVVGWSVEVITRVEYVMHMTQGNVKQELGFES